MMLTLSLVLAAVAAVSLVFAVASARARRDLARVQEARNEIYRGCFLRGLAGIFAKMARADGTVSIDEASVAVKLFEDMGLRDSDLSLCHEAFKSAKESNLPMSYYASLFAPYSSVESRALVYEIVWDIAAADGRLEPSEDTHLKELVRWLSLSVDEYRRNLDRCAGRVRDLRGAAQAAGAKIGRILG